MVTSQTFDPLTGQLSTIKAGAGNAVQNFGFRYDTIGNLTSRSDANTGLSEIFGYDNLNRMTSATLGANPAKTVSYDTTASSPSPISALTPIPRLASRGIGVSADIGLGEDAVVS